MTVWTILLAIVLIGVLIIIHEAGHFGVARLLKVPVEEFAVGFGQKLLQRKTRSGTLFTLRAFPLGGFCRFRAEEEDFDAPGSFYAEPKWKRLLIYLAGSGANVLYAFLMIFAMVMIAGFSYSTARIDRVVPNSAAEAAGVLPDDMLISLGGVSITQSESFSRVLIENVDKPVELVIERGGVEQTLTLIPRLDPAENRVLMGVYFQTERYQPTFMEGIRSGGLFIAEYTKEIGRILVGLVTRGEGGENFVGPIGTITTVAEQTSSGGFLAFLSMSVNISLSLGLMNLLPIPSLDGSQILVLGIEAVRRKPINRERVGMVFFVGFIIMAGLGLLLTFRDVVNLFR